MRIKMWRNAVAGILAVGVLWQASCISYAFSGMAERDSDLARMLSRAKEQEAAVTGEEAQFLPDSRFLVSSRTENDIRVTSGADLCMELGAGTDGCFYVIGKNYMPEGSVLPVMFGGRIEYSCTLEEETVFDGDRYYLVRFAVRSVGPADGYPEVGQAGGGLSDGLAGDGSLPDGESGGGSLAGGLGGAETLSDDELPSGRHWKEGDAVIRSLNGVSYSFHCIDSSYGDGVSDGGSFALFLCDSVIPANMGSEYVYGQREDGSYGYRFSPGPIVNFGESSEYAISAVREWLKSLEKDTFPCVGTGVTQSYLGQTEAGSFGQFDSGLLHGHYLGSQLLLDHYFILSVEEALRYREYLWRVDGMDEEETAASAPSFARGYWLRTPYGAGENPDLGCVYVVDLVNGNLHPQAVMPGRGDAKDALSAEDEELAVTSPVGVRPAFVLKQK